MDTELMTIINSAIAQEELSHEFYQRMANLVSQAETKETFQYLAQEELEHTEDGYETRAYKNH